MPYTQDQKERAAEIARQRAEQVRRERERQIAAVLARNADLKKKMQG